MSGPTLRQMIDAAALAGPTRRLGEREREAMRRLKLIHDALEQRVLTIKKGDVDIENPTRDDLLVWTDLELTLHRPKEQP